MATTLPNTGAVTAGGATYYTNPYSDFGITFYETQPSYNQYSNNDEYGVDGDGNRGGEEDYDDGADLGAGEGDYPYDDDESASFPSINSAGYNYAQGGANYNNTQGGTNYNSVPYSEYGYTNYNAGYTNPYQNVFVQNNISTAKKGNAM